jgi:pyrophosphatase PpaX
MRQLEMEDMVDEIVTMNDVTEHKPNPETAEAVLRKLAAHDDRGLSDDVRGMAIFIGDSKYDIGCAQNAGIDSVLVGWSHYVDEEDMLAFGVEPTYRIKTPAELLDII